MPGEKTINLHHATIHAMRIDPTTLALVAGLYFAFLMLIARLTAGRGSQQDFFIGSRQSPWPVVAIGMIGASLSGVTFISHGRRLNWL